AVVARAFDADVSRAPVEDAGEAKTRLQELTQRLFRTAPEYTLLRATGPDHAKDFESHVAVAGRVLGSGRGGSKKLAEQAAAREALARLERESAALAAGTPPTEPSGTSASSTSEGEGA